MPRKLGEQDLYRIVFLWESREQRPPSDRSYRWIGREVGCHRNTVQEVLRRNRERGTPVIPVGNKIARPIATTDNQDHRISELSRKEPFLVPKVSMHGCLIVCSSSTS